MSHNVNQVEIEKAAPAVEAKKTEHRSIERLLKAIMFESTENLRLQKLAELKKLSNSQNEIAFLSNLKRIFMVGAKEDGSFEVNEELEKLLKRMSNPGNESLMQLLVDLGLDFNAVYNEANFTTLFNNIESLNTEDRDLLINKLFSLGIEKGKIPTEEQLKALVEAVSQSDNLALRKQLTESNILSTKKSFSKPERENFVESIRLAIEQKSTLNEMVIQTATRLQTEIDQRQQYVIMALKIYNDAKKSIGSRIGR